MLLDIARGHSILVAKSCLIKTKNWPLSGLSCNVKYFSTSMCSLLKYSARKCWSRKREGIVFIATAHVHSVEWKLGFCAGSSPARAVLKFYYFVNKFCWSVYQPFRGVVVIITHGVLKIFLHFDEVSPYGPPISTPRTRCWLAFLPLNQASSKFLWGVLY